MNEPDDFNEFSLTQQIKLEIIKGAAKTSMYMLVFNV